MSDEDESATETWRMNIKYTVLSHFFLHCNNSATTLAWLGKMYVNDI